MVGWLAHSLICDRDIGYMCPLIDVQYGTLVAAFLGVQLYFQQCGEVATDAHGGDFNVITSLQQVEHAP